MVLVPRDIIVLVGVLQRAGVLIPDAAQGARRPVSIGEIRHHLLVGRLVEGVLVRGVGELLQCGL